MTKTWKTKKLKTFANALAHMDDTKDILNFLRDVCTTEELDALSSRFQVAQMLADGETYRSIAQKTGVSTTTVTRIAHWMNEGEKGYAVALKATQKKMIS